MKVGPCHYFLKQVIVYSPVIAGFSPVRLQKPSDQETEILSGSISEPIRRE
jgi:hypothetical protein